MKITNDMLISENGFLIEDEISDNLSYTPDGFLLAENVKIGRTGTQVYAPDEIPEIEPGADGLIRIQRTEEEVFNENVLASANGKPVTIDHPVEGVSPENWDKVAVGTMLNPRREGNYLVADLLITSDYGIDQVINNKLRQVSLGYSADYKQISPGHGIQTGIVLNHLSIVEKGRAGPSCSIQDSINTNLLNNPLQEETKMSKTKSALSRFLKSWKTFDSEIEELEKEITDEDETETCDEENSIESRLSKIEDAIAELTKSEKEETSDEDKEDEKEELEKTEDEDEDEEEKMTGDSISKAEILVPGNKLTSKREVLRVVTGDSKTIVNSLLAGKKVKDLSEDAISVLFESAASIKAMKNNSKMKAGTTGTTDSLVRKQFTGSDWNKVFAEFHGKK